MKHSVYWSEEGFKGTVANRTWNSMNEGSPWNNVNSPLKNTLPFIIWFWFKSKKNYFFFFLAGCKIFQMFLYKSFRALCPHLIFLFRPFSLCLKFSKIDENRILKEANFWNLDHLQTYHRVMWGPLQNLGPIGSAFMTFIGYKQTNRHPNKQSIYIDYRCL